MVNSETMRLLDELGFGADIDKLENYVAQLQDAAGLGKPIVTDTVYDMHIRLLEEVRPESYVLNRNWEGNDEELTDLDIILNDYGMCSIKTINFKSELQKFKDALGYRKVDLLASTKLDGHAVRAVYNYGSLVEATTRGRYKRGRSILRHAKVILPEHVQDWEQYELVEIRGEMLISLMNFEKYKGILKTPLAAVTSLIRDSATEEEIRDLSCLCYKCIIHDDNVDYFEESETLADEIDYLEQLGFSTPKRLLVEDVDVNNLDDAVDDILEHFEELYEDDNIGYGCDGIVVAINDIKTFYEMPMNGNARMGNFALKMGKVWECNMYSSTIESIEWVPGKIYLTPKAKVTPIVTANGTTITTVPLYNVGVMEAYGYVPGSTIFCKYGGEQGVKCCAPDGTSISEAWR